MKRRDVIIMVIGVFLLMAGNWAIVAFGKLRAAGARANAVEMDRASLEEDRQIRAEAVELAEPHISTADAEKAHAAVVLLSKRAHDSALRSRLGILLQMLDAERGYLRTMDNNGAADPKHATQDQLIEQNKTNQALGRNRLGIGMARDMLIRWRP